MELSKKLFHYLKLTRGIKVPTTVYEYEVDRKSSFRAIKPLQEDL